MYMNLIEILETLFVFIKMDLFLSAYSWAANNKIAACWKQ